MTSGEPWNERGLSPELYQAAREAARRAGMSVDEWLKATFGDLPPQANEKPRGTLSGRLGELSQRFDRSFGDEHMTDAVIPPVRSGRLADTVAKLNARLEQLTSGRPSEKTTSAPAEEAPRAEAAPAAPAPEKVDFGIDAAVAEIEERQRAIEAAAPPPPPAETKKSSSKRAAAPTAPAATTTAAAAPVATTAAPATPAAPVASAATGAPGDITNLERQLQDITVQLETLKRPSALESAVAAMRSDLSRISHEISDALPRRALETLQDQISALTERVERGLGRGGDPDVLERIEQDLRHVHAALNAMTPAESLGDFNERIAELSQKMDGLSGGAPDTETLRYLEAAIIELRELSAGVASAEGVASLAGDVQALSARIDMIAERTSTGGLNLLARSRRGIDRRTRHPHRRDGNADAASACCADTRSACCADAGAARAGTVVQRQSGPACARYV